MLQSSIGRVRVLSRAGDRRLWVLDANSAILWDLHTDGVDPALITEEFAQRFGMAMETACRYLDQIHDSWRAVGLLDADAFDQRAADDPFQPIPTFPAPDVFLTPPGSWRLIVAQQPVVVEVADVDLRAALEPLLAPLCGPVSPSHCEVVADRVMLAGDATGWRLTINGAELDEGASRDAALVAMLSALTELGCRTRERLLVVHGAGLVASDGRCLLLAAPGGSGKSTLAMALEAEGFRLLSDDVVPIRSDGAALGLGLPACVKRGSWPVLAGLRPELEQGAEAVRFGQMVRFLPPKNRPMTGAIKPGLLLFPQYRPDAAPDCALLPPEQALQRLVEAEAVIRDLTQEKLDAICCWISAMPAYAVHYPDLASGMSMVRMVLGNCTAPFQ